MEKLITSGTLFFNPWTILATWLLQEAPQNIK
jgi:hypothetical protein